MNPGMPKASSTAPTREQQPKETSQQSLEVLRVASQELSSGNQTGQVFLQLSPGAVAFSLERPVLQARVSRLLHEAIEKDSDL